MYNKRRQRLQQNFHKEKRMKLNMGKLVLIPYVVLLFALLVALPQCDALLLNVEGKVYCDTCRIQRETRISQPLEGAEVELKCRSRLSGIQSGTARAKSDKEGKYIISIEGAFEKGELCDVTAISSPRMDCNEPMDEHNRVVPTKTIGVTGERRYASPIGFMITKALPECKQVFSEIGHVAAIE